MSTWKHRIIEGSAIVALLGLAFVIGGVVFWYSALVPRTTAVYETLYELVIHVLFGGVILILGAHIERSDLLPEEEFSAIIWCYGGFTLMFALSVWGHIGSILNGSLTVSFVSDFIVFASLGGAFGVIAGTNWGRATRNEILAKRNEEQRETLALLTRLLSHDIRNDMTIIQSYSEILMESVDEEQEASYVEIIQDTTDDTVRLLEDTSTLVKSFSDDREFEVINLSDVLQDEIATIEENHPEVTLRTDIQSGMMVKADPLVHQMFSNLLQNAVFHNDETELTITVRADQNENSTDITIRDDGTGIPPDMRETCFELGEQGPDSNGDGIGLYLVSRLADLYDGSIAVDESPDGGASFRISLPTPETGDAH